MPPYLKYKINVITYVPNFKVSLSTGRNLDIHLRKKFISQKLHVLMAACLHCSVIFDVGFYLDISVDNFQ
jgi:hypothetical protein